MTSEDDRGFCVYYHRRKDTGEIVYVGEGRRVRAYTIKSNHGRNKAYSDIVEKFGVFVEIVEENLTKDGAERMEESLIVELRESGVALTNVHRGSTSGKSYLRENLEHLFYVDASSPSGLRWKTDRYTLKTHGYQLAKKDEVAGCKVKTTGYWRYMNMACHRIVYALVYGECPAGLTIDHVDGNKDNNDIRNLELVTAGENSRRATVDREPKRGSEVFSSKLTEDDVLEMYQLFLSGESNDTIATKFNVHPRYVSLIRHGRRWKHLYVDQKEKFPKSFKELVVTKEQILAAFDLINQTTMTNQAIAELVGIEVSNVSRLRHGKIYKRVINTERNLNC